MDVTPITALITEMQTALLALPLPERGLDLLMLIPDFPDAVHNHIDRERISLIQYRHRIEAVRTLSQRLLDAIAALMANGYPHVPDESVSKAFLALFDQQLAAVFAAKQRFQLVAGASVLPEVPS